MDGTDAVVGWSGLDGRVAVAVAVARSCACCNCKMFSMLFANIFYPEVIYDQYKLNWTPLVLPKPWRGNSFKVARFLQSFS